MIKIKLAAEYCYCAVASVVLSAHFKKLSGLPYADFFMCIPCQYGNFTGLTNKSTGLIANRI